MTRCAACIPWNFPLHLRPDANGFVRPMNYQENVGYALHVLHHQSPDSWQGEIEQYVAELKTIVQPEPLLDATILPS